jgi:hypothetical protein
MSSTSEHYTGGYQQDSFSPEGGVPPHIADGVDASIIRALRYRASGAPPQPERALDDTAIEGVVGTGPDAATVVLSGLPGETQTDVPRRGATRRPADQHTGAYRIQDTERVMTTRQGSRATGTRSASPRPVESTGGSRKVGWTRGKILALGTAGIVAGGGIGVIIADPFAGPAVVTAAQAANTPNFGFDAALANKDNAPVAAVLNEQQGLQDEVEIWTAYEPYVVAAANNPVLVSGALPDRQEVRLVLEALTYTPYSGENASPTNADGPLNMPSNVLDSLLKEMNSRAKELDVAPLELVEPNSAEAIEHNLLVYMAAGLYQVENVYPAWAKGHPRQTMADFIDYAFGSNTSGEVYVELSGKTDPALQTALAHSQLDANIAATILGLQAVNLVSQSSATGSSS